jgi:hypothetical protein
VRSLKLQVLLLLVAVLAVGALAADVVLKNRAETELAAEVVRRVPDATGVQAKISSFPFVGRLLLSDEVKGVVVTAQHARVGDLSLADVRVEAEDVEMDPAAARDGRAVVRSIGRGTAQADLRQDQIDERMPSRFSVRLEEGRALVTGPAGVKAELLVTEKGALRLQVSERTLLELEVPKTDLLPCPIGVTFVNGAARLACTFDEVPPLLLDLAKR